MAENQRLNAAEYLDRFFDELRAEVRSNPKLAERLVRSLGGQVVFEDETRADIANPYALAGEANKARFFAVFGAMKPGQIRKVMRDHNLATTVDMSGKSAQQLIDMMYDRALTKVGERKSSVF